MGLTRDSRLPGFKQQKDTEHILKLEFDGKTRMPGKTNNLRDKLEDNQLDLSLSQLTEVPVQEIVSILSLFFYALIVTSIFRASCPRELTWICPITF